MSGLLLLHGPNLDLLGRREPSIYGVQSLAEIDARCAGLAREAGVGFAAFQSNAEHELIGRVHAAARDGTDFLVINPAAFTHTSIALRDALLGVGLPYIEVHLSNIHAREPFRRISYFSDRAEGVISGLGALGYELACRAAIARLSRAHARQK